MSRNQVVLCLLLAVTVSAHTWVGCTNMVNGVCQGYIRNYKGRNTGNVGVDDFYTTKTLGRTTGFNVCSQYQKDKIYTSEYPMATAYAGQSLNVMYTPNGHSQPGDHGLQTTSRIHWTGRTDTQLVTREDLTDANKIGEWNYGSNCATSGDVASLPCINGFKIPDGTAPGTYQVVWYWPYDRDQNQRPLGEDYYSCFDVQVLPSANTPTSQPTQQTSQPNQSSNQQSTPGSSATSNLCPASMLDDCKAFCGGVAATVCECDPATGAKKLVCGEEASSSSFISIGLPIALLALMGFFL